MQECHFCKTIIKDEDPFCKNCGYNPKTDTVSKDFVPPAKPIKSSTRKGIGLFSGGVSSGVKKFAFIGLAILVFSIFYKNHFNINNVAAEIKYFCTMVSKGKFKFEQDKRSKKIEWINVRDFKDN